ncbi:TetR/AcrR family transcriptional regulator [Planomicrobium sp. CPCC 101079]|uniref:TetR/AcrR family transcriptional regulator n=1 Tax=Planomicrobium sp. CPCC 101079 TaxID=2599618 RepID=UPI0011B620D8|nr:TetR/AcrR family transcriptional regulator [Planomicrobium sp. CPCC 101079]TWT14607.1 TetR/AcrR family transcriptional regulator [Planomicrobium sp. CPCC 101079]
MGSKRSAKDQLIETASRLFRLRGYHGVGLKEIIEESGTAKGSLYHYFPEGKEQLAIAAIEHTKNFVSDKVQEDLAEAADPINAIQGHIQKLAQEFNKDSVFGLPIGTIAGETYLTNEPIRAACQSVFDEWQRLYEEKLLSSGYSEKQSADYALVLIALIEGGIILSIASKSGEALSRIASQIPLLIKK